MINAVRNYLLNERRRDVIPPAPWDAYMPDSFRPIMLPHDLERVHYILVPKTQNWWSRSYWTEQILSVLRDYPEFYAFPDPRILPAAGKVVDAQVGTVLTPLNVFAESKHGAAAIYQDGSAQSEPFKSWVVTYTGAGMFKVHETHKTPVYVQYSGPIQLGYGVVFSVNIQTLATDAAWAVNLYTGTGNHLAQVSDELRQYIDNKFFYDGTVYYDNFAYLFKTEPVAAVAFTYVKKYHKLYESGSV